MKGIYLYGAGGYGRDAYDRFQKENKTAHIIGVIDNNPEYKGTDFFGLPIKSYADTLPLLDNECTVIITPNISTSLKIADQLKKDGVRRYLHWSYEQHYDLDEVLKIANDENAYAIYTRSLENEMKTISYQRDYLLKHIDPKTMKPATGATRKRQLELIELAREFLKDVEKLDVHPFLMGGNLLGYYRHGGFIPWDDDLDLAIMRDEYERIKDYLKQNYYYSIYDGQPNNDNQQIAWYRKEVSEHPNTIIALERPLLLRVCKLSDDGEVLFIDLFPIDRYRDDLNFEEYWSFISSFTSVFSKANSVKEYYEIIEDIKEKDKRNITSAGNKLYYGHDCTAMLLYDGTVQAFFVPSETVFPLKSVNYEGLETYVPCEPQVWIEYDCGKRYMDIPSNVALHTHFGTQQDKVVD